jgi:hypothetical protein
MENVKIGKSNIPTLEENNSANYLVSSKMTDLTEINYYPEGLLEIDMLSNHFDYKELKEIAAPNTRS